MSVLSSKKIRGLSLGFPMATDDLPEFKFGSFIVLRGNAADFMSFVLSVRAQLPFEQGGLESSTVFVDGGNMFSPYSIAEIARGHGLDPRVVLGKIYVSRAFTAYQLLSLITEKLDLALRKKKAKLLLILDIASLFLDLDVPPTEAREFFVKVCSKLSEIASKKETVVAVNYYPDRHSIRSLFLETILFGKCNVLIRLQKAREVFTFALEYHSHIKPFSRDFTLNNMSLEPFLGA